MSTRSLKQAMELYIDLARTADDSRARESYSGNSTQGPRYLSTSRFRKHQLKIDEPAEFGGADSALNPAEALLGALAASMEVTCRAWAEYMGIPCGDLTTDISGDLDLRGFMNTHEGIRAGFKNLKAQMWVSGPVTNAQLNDLRRLVERCCPILDTVKNGSDLAVQIGRLEPRPARPG